MLMMLILVFWVVCWTAWLVTEPTILKALFSFEKSGSDNPAAQHHITLYECKNVCSMTKRTKSWPYSINPLNAELNPICHLLALVGAHPIFHVSRIKVNSL
jgi:hypothetical protein